MDTTFPFCANVTDDFNGYSTNANFQSLGVTNGPFAVLGNVMWDAGVIATTYQGGQQIGALALDALQALEGNDCAMTVKIVDVDGGGQASFGFSSGGMYFGIRVEGSGAQPQLRFDSAPDVSVDLPVYLALIRVQNLWYGAYREPQQMSWTFLPPSPSGKAPPPTFPMQAPFGFGQIQNAGTTSQWDDFNVATVPLTAVP